MPWLLLAQCQVLPSKHSTLSAVSKTDLCPPLHTDSITQGICLAVQLEVGSASSQHRHILSVCCKTYSRKISTLVVIFWVSPFSWFKAVEISRKIHQESRLTLAVLRRLFNTLESRRGAEHDQPYSTLHAAENSPAFGARRVWKVSTCSPTWKGTSVGHGEAIAWVRWKKKMEFDHTKLTKEHKHLALTKTDQDWPCDLQRIQDTKVD